MCIAAALATMDIVEQEAIQNAEHIGRRMMRRMRNWPAKHRLVGEVRGRGLMIGVEIVRNRKPRVPGARERDAIIQLAFKRGVLFLGAGENVVRISPPLIVSREQADIAMDVLEEAIQQVEDRKKRANGIL